MAKRRVAQSSPDGKSVVYLLYLITCLVSGRQYVGFTSAPVDVRWQRHCAYARRGKKLILSQAIVKYGSEAFVVEHIATTLGLENACAIETDLIAQYGTYMPSGYNMTLGGQGGCGNHYAKTDGHKAKIAATLMGRKLPDEHKAAIAAGRAPCQAQLDFDNIAATGTTYTPWGRSARYMSGRSRKRPVLVQRTGRSVVVTPGQLEMDRDL